MNRCPTASTRTELWPISVTRMKACLAVRREARWNDEHRAPAIADDFGRDAAEDPTLQTLVPQTSDRDEVGATLVSARQQLGSRHTVSHDPLHVNARWWFELVDQSLECRL